MKEKTGILNWNPIKIGSQMLQRKSRERERERERYGEGENCYSDYLTKITKEKKLMCFMRGNYSYYYYYYSVLETWILLFFIIMLTLDLVIVDFVDIDSTACAQELLFIIKFAHT